MPNNFCMKLYKFAFLTLIFIFPHKISYGQNLLKSQNKTEFTYIYKLDNESALEILKSWQIKDSAKYFTNLVDSFSNVNPGNYKERLTPGQYILYQATNRTLSLSLLEISDIIVKVNGLNNKNNINVYDLMGKPLFDNIKVFTKEDKEIPLNNNLKCWSFDINKNETQYFYILNNTALTYYRLKRHKINTVKPKSNKTYAQILPGYLVLNQPAYKKNDSLIFKAFLLKKNGKPYNRTIKLKIYDQKARKFNLEKELKPLSRGAYSYAFQIPDSFNLDSYYSIYLTNKNGRHLKSTTFRVENYQKRNATYTAQMEKSSFYRGEKIYFHLSCFDANDLPMADTKIDINLTIANIQDFYDDSLFVPYSWQTKSYWSKVLNSDPTGNTEVLLPDSLFFNARMTFNAHIKFINADGENAGRNLKFSYNPQKERFLFYQLGDSIKAIYLENSEVKSKPARILSYYDKLLDDKEVILPYTFHIEEFPKYYSLFVDSIHRATIRPKNPNSNLVKFEGYRNYDSLVLKLDNKAGVNVSYWIYQKNKILLKGNSINFSINKAIKGGKSIDIIYTYRLAGEKYTYVQSFHHQEKTLKVESNIPRKIYPGQEVVVKMNVKNHKGKNKKNVNLAAYAINAKVEGIASPDMPYFGKSKHGLFNTFSTTLSSINIRANKTIDTNYIKWLNLRNTGYYNFTYSKEGYILQYDSIEKYATEFAPYLIKNGYFLKITEIYIDDELAFIDKSYFSTPYSLRVKPGKHKIVLRARDRFITVNDIEFKKGFKLFMGIEQDSIYKFKNMKFSKAEPQYYEEEKEQIRKKLLVFTSRITKLFYITQGDYIYKSNNYNRHRSNGYMIVGPLKAGKTKVITSSLDTLEFFFQPGYVYHFTDTSITPSSSYNQNMGNNIFRNRSYSYVNFHGGARAITIIKAKEKIKQAPKRKPNPYLKNYDRSNTLKTHGTLVTRQLNQIRINKSWLINASDSLNSKYFTYNMRNFGRLKPGDYQLIYMGTDSSIFRRYIHITADGTNYRYYKDSTFLPYDSVLIKKLENLVIALNTPKPRDFNIPPKMITNYVASTYKNNRNKTYFKGNIVDLNFNPIRNAIILLERDGIFVRGAYTNLAGSFVFIDSLEGRYQMKIFIQNKFFNYYNTFIVKNTTNTANIVLPDYIFGNRISNQGGVNDVFAYNDENASYTTSAAAPMNYESMAKMSSIQISANKLRKIPSINLNINKTINNIHKDKQSSNFINTTVDKDMAINSEEKMRMEELKKDQKSNRIRSNFRDYGFFVPNLLTNRKGEAYFTVQFPDNQTMWKTFFPAVDYRKNTGLLEINIQAYKPLSASIALPHFLIEGDICKVNGKISNYIGEAIELRPWFKIESDSNTLKLTAPKHFEVFPRNISFTGLGKKEITFGFKTQDGYLDAERRTIPVLVNGIEVSTSEHNYAKNNFTKNYKADTNLISRSLFITNNQLDVLMEEINYLKNYGYGCNEQNASKIKALLAEKLIKKALDLPFIDEITIEKTLSKLEKNQNNDGSWGWWKKGDQSEMWMTIYITDALNMAVKAGYSSSAIFKALAYLEKSLNSMNISDRLYSIDILCNYNSPKKYKSNIEKIEKLKLNYFDKFRLIRIQQKMGRPYSIQEVIQSSNRDPYGIYWGEKVMNFKVNIIQTSSLAYNILKNEKAHHQVMLEETRNYFLTHLSKNRNTIERAVLLQDITDDIIANNSISKEIRSELKINGKLMPQKYPIIMTFKNTDDIYIEKTGAPLQISVYETSIQNPQKKTDTLFSVNTYFQKGDDSLSQIKLGEKFQHHGSFRVKKAAEFVMLEIPIPAGAVFLNKNTSHLPYETHREYHDDKVVIFFRRIPKGNYYFNIDLESRFAGQYNVIPTKLSLMYFPDVFGFSNSRIFRIVE